MKTGPAIATELAVGVLCTGAIAGLIGSEFIGWKLGFDPSILVDVQQSQNGLMRFWLIAVWAVTVDHPVVTQGVAIAGAAWSGMLAGWLFGMHVLTRDVQDRLEHRYRFHHIREPRDDDRVVGG